MEPALLLLFLAAPACGVGVALLLARRDLRGLVPARHRRLRPSAAPGSVPAALPAPGREAAASLPPDAGGTATKLALFAVGACLVAAGQYGSWISLGELTNHPDYEKPLVVVAGAPVVGLLSLLAVAAHASADRSLGRVFAAAVAPLLAYWAMLFGLAIALLWLGLLSFG